ncbi:Acetaldehyde dehydrogenase [Dirofilaria immitis]
MDELIKQDQVNVFIASTKLARIEKWFWKIAEDSINSITLNRSMRINASNDSVEESTDLILCNSQTASFPAITHLWRAPQPFIPYYFTSSPPQFSQFSSYLPYYSKTTATTPQQKYQNKKKMWKSSKSHFWCAGIAQLLWMIASIVALGLLAILIFALLII